MDKPRELLKPIKARWILLSVALALVVELLPLGGSTRFLPDFAALMVMYWSINQPSRFGIVLAFLVGIACDFTSASVIGQHALAYTFTTYLITLRQRQVVMYNLGQQALVVLALLLLNQAIMWITRVALGSAPVGLGYFTSPFVGALLWPLVTNILIIPQRRGRPG
ncbi:rod shape-determining protein MreD [Microvirgula aerodenitrificans]|uniref:rod shape-determining protein MreD n=1 Tax=Microvirgula aerodenitrificans TaxID=57480 RepID=UPI00048FD9B4|nr:rod shape-determining protein MreD [Microvirgula aerodenitrificans]